VAKTSGITTTVTIDDKDGSANAISNDVTSITTNTSRGVQDVTGVDKAAMERILLLSDGTLQLQGVFNTASAMSHATLSTVTDNDTRTVAIGYPGATLTMEMVLHAYNVSRAQDGSLTWTADLSLANGTAPAWT